MADRLTRINQQIADERQLYLAAIWAGDTAKADGHQAAVNRLLELHLYVSTHPTFTTT